MDVNELEHLLGKYYDGLTTEDEERRLREAMTDAPESLRADREFFHSMAQIDDTSFPQNLRDALRDKIDSLDAEDRRLSRRRLLFRFGYRAAAALILAAGLWWTFRTPTVTAPKDTFDSPEEAYAATIDALTIFAEKYNESLAKIEYADSTINKANKKANELINKMNRI